MIARYANLIILGAVSSVGIAGWIYYQSLLLNISNLEKENLELANAISTVTNHYEKEVDKVQDEITKQNEQVRALEEHGNLLSDKLNAALVVAKTTKTIYQSEIAKILEAKAPETCDEAIQYLIISKDQLKWKD